MALALAGCGHAPPAVVAAPAPPSVTKAATPADGGLELTLRPEPRPSPHVHVELRAAGRPTQSLRLVTGSVESLVVADDGGRIATTIAATDGGSTVTLARAPRGTWRIAYDVPATADARAVTAAVVVAEDRFRAFGERIVLLPASFENERASLTVHVDGEAIRAPSAASSFGNGTTRTREGTGRALVRAAYVAGSLGSASFTEALDIDHASWLGYTSFDPRPAVAEVAQIRTAMREEWKGGGEPEHALLFFSTARPVGSYALVPRAGSLVVHLGPSEPWSPALRVAITQHLMHAWLGGELRLTGDADPTWFNEGFARYLGARLLEQLGLLKPQDAQDYTSGLLAMQATLPLRGQSLAALAAAGTPVARATMMARGALYAQRLATRLRARGDHTLESAIILPMLRAAREGHPAVSPEAIEAAIEKELPDAKRDRDLLDSGADVTLPPNALGPCFRLRDGDYRTFELGFDLTATLDSETHAVVGVTPGSAAAAAGLVNGDVLDDASYRDGHAEIPAKLSIVRGEKKLTLTYAPTGARKKGQIVERLPVPDAKCGTVL